MNTDLLKNVLLALALVISFKAEAGGRYGGEPARKTIGSGGPSISYHTSQTYTAGTAISPLAPTASGVYASSYNSAAYAYNGRGITYSYGIAMGPGGDLYMIDISNNTVKKLPADGGNAVVVASGFSGITALAVDAAGNIYVADQNADISRVAAGTGAVTTIGFGIIQPMGVAVDASGNVYVADRGNNEVEEILQGYNSTIVIGSGFSGVTGIAVDAKGNAYVTDGGNGHVVKISSGGASQTEIASGFRAPIGIAVDNGGNVFVVDQDNGSVSRIPAGGGSVITLNQTFANPSGVTIDGYGNLYVSTTADSHGDFLDRLTPTGGYFISPALPSGLSFDGNTGIISGTPTAASPATNYTVSAYNPLGGATSALSIKVVSLPPVISYASSASYTVFTPISPLSPLATGVASPGYGTAVVLAPGPSIPPNIAVDGGANVLAADVTGYIEKFSPGSTIPDTIQAGFSSPGGIAVDAAGNIYVTDIGTEKVYKIPAGTTTHTSIGQGFSNPLGVAVDGAGNVYVADYYSSSIIEILASNGTTVSVGSGFTHPQSVALDGVGNIYVNDGGNGNIYRMPPGGGTPVLLVNSLSNGMAVDNAGNVYLTSIYAGVYEVPAGTTSLVAVGPPGFLASGLAIDQSGVLYVSTPDNTISKINPTGGYYISPALPSGLSFNSATGVISGASNYTSPPITYQIAAYNAGGSASAAVTIEVRVITAATLSYASPKTYTVGTAILALSPTSNGVAAAGYNSTATITASGFNAPQGVAVDAAGNIFIGDKLNNIVEEIPAGSSTPFTIATGFNRPFGVAVDAAGNVYVADFNNNAVKKIAPGGSPVTTIGSGFSNPAGVAVDQKGNVYVADFGNDEVKKIPAGNGTPVTIAAGFTEPYDVAVDSTGNVYVADFGDQAIVKIPAGGGETVTIGSGYGSPTGVAVDASGNIFIADASLKAIEEIPANGGNMITLVSGSNVFANVAVSPSGVVYATDQTNNQVKQINPTGGYYLSIPLPAGLSFSNVTGVISGTPTVSSPAADYTVTAYNAGGGTQAGVNISVVNSALLKGLSISNGTLSPAFATGTTSYTVSEPNSVGSVVIRPTASDATATIKVNGTTVVSGSLSGQIPLAAGANTISVVVTASDGVTTQTYTITATRAPSSVASLSALTISSGTLSPVFAMGTTTYSVSEANTVASVFVRPTAGGTGATIKVNGTTVASGALSGQIPLSVGSNTISVVVTAQDGTTKQTYTITATRAPSAVATLSALTISAGTLTPAFAAATTSYTIPETNATAAITLRPTATSIVATIKVNGTAVTSGSVSGSIPLSVGSNAITVVVTAQDGTTKQTYTITANRAGTSTNANLSALTISAGTLTPAFATATASYAVSEANSVTAVFVRPTASDATATIKVNGTAVASGVVSGKITLAVGPNTISVVVTASDEVTTKTYTITATRAAGGIDGFDPGISVTKPTETATIAEDGVTVHQGISPNGDGINDFLQIDNISQYPDNKLTIMNRSGQLIYEAKGYDNSSKTFDGHSNKNGKMQSPGTYFYQLDYTVNGVTKHKTGFIVLKY